MQSRISETHLEEFGVLVTTGLERSTMVGTTSLFLWCTLVSGECPNRNGLGVMNVCRAEREHSPLPDLS